MKFSWLLAVVLVLSPAALYAQDKKSFNAKPALVPYRLSDTQHTIVRVKINGKGPFNFVVDTGCPVFLIAEPVGKKVGLDKGWVTLDKLELEGGLELKDVKARVETPFQIEGMNGMGLAGVELHGLMGYTVLAKYKMNYDYTTRQMVWTPVKAEPLAPVQRGFFGFEMEEKDKQVRVTNVLADTPAAKAGLKKGDRIVSIDGKEVTTVSELMERTTKTLPGKIAAFAIERDKEKQDLKITAGEAKGAASGGMDVMVGIVRVLTFLSGVGPPPPPQPRGFFGFELDEKDKMVRVARVLADSPAAKAGLKKGDRIVSIESKSITEVKEVLQHASKITAGKTLNVTVERGSEKVELKITAGDGL